MCATCLVLILILTPSGISSIIHTLGFPVKYVEELLVKYFGKTSLEALLEKFLVELIKTFPKKFSVKYLEESPAEFRENFKLEFLTKLLVKFY